MADSSITRNCYGGVEATVKLKSCKRNLSDGLLNAAGVARRTTECERDQVIEFEAALLGFRKPGLAKLLDLNSIGHGPSWPHRFGPPDGTNCLLDRGLRYGRVDW
jgi:hypothetical protein